MQTSYAALLLVAVASLGWAGFDSARKVLAGRIAPAPLLLLLTAASAPLFAIWAAVDGWPVVAPGYIAPAAGSVGLNVVANLAFFVAIRSSSLSVTIPLLSLTPVFAALLAIPVLGERPTALQWLGIALVVVGAGALSARRGQEDGPGFWQSLRNERGPLWMAMVALLWSVTIPLDKMAAERSSAAFHGMMVNVGVGAVVFLWLVARRQLGEVAGVRQAPGAFVLAIIASTLALGLQLTALQMIWVGFVETVKRGVGNVLAVVLGRIVFGEAITAGKLASVALMALGVGLILVPS